VSLEKNAQKVAVLIGNSDGIGLKTTSLLLDKGYQVIGISKSPVSIDNANYKHVVQDVSDENYRVVLQGILTSISRTDLCIYFVGIGTLINLENLADDTKVFQVNLMSAVITTELVVTEMLKRGYGHFIGLSSIADVLISAEAPSYMASKAGVSNYWEGLALALAHKNVKVSNIRFGFVDTKMAKSARKPFLLTTQKAAEFIFNVIENPRPRATKPLLMGFVFWLYSLPVRLKLLRL
jgi:short-subunit dehydrogenase